MAPVFREPPPAPQGLVEELTDGAAVVVVRLVKACGRHGDALAGALARVLVELTVNLQGSGLRIGRTFLI